MAFWYVATGPCWATESTSLRTWSGRALAMPSSDIRASLTFIISVPVEIKEYSDPDQDAARLAGRLGHVEHQELPGAVVLRHLLHLSFPPCVARQTLNRFRLLQLARCGTRAPDSAAARSAWTRRGGPSAGLRSARTSDSRRRNPVETSSPPTSTSSTTSRRSFVTQARSGAPNDAFGRSMISSGSHCRAASFSAAFCTRPRIFSLPGRENAALNTNGSTNGTLTSVDAAMLARSV